MVPPVYADLGKGARDLFSKGYSKYDFFFFSYQVCSLNNLEYFKQVLI